MKYGVIYHDFLGIWIIRQITDSSHTSISYRKARQGAFFFCIQEAFYAIDDVLLALKPNVQTLEMRTEGIPLQVGAKSSHHYSPIYRALATLFTLCFNRKQ